MKDNQRFRFPGRAFSRSFSGFVACVGIVFSVSLPGTILRRSPYSNSFCVFYGAGLLVTCDGPVLR